MFVPVVVLLGSRLGLGSVLAPLLFLFYINNLGSSLSDVWILTTAHEKGDAEVAVQSVFNFVFDWSKQWTLNLNADKKEVCSFSTRSNDSACPPFLFIGSD